EDKGKFIWRIAASHTIAYFIAGIFALVFMDYKEQFGSDFMSVLMRPIESPWVAVGPGLQVIRGVIVALVLLPFKDIFINRYGWLKLAALILGLSYFATLGPVFGSFDGYLYTKIPLQYHLLGLPETLIYTFLFAFIIYVWYKMPGKVWNIISVAFVILIILMSFLGLLASLGIISS
ncbi:MAG: hypothetical protein U9N53_06690, partial [Bacteroidota bacterium]|nr:hypothetical protein [Bacteroidota bacterium]